MAVKKGHDRSAALGAARARRARGAYDLATLRLFYHSWYHHRDPATLVPWLRFRRDLGYPLSARNYERLKKATGPRWKSLLVPGLSLVEAEQGRRLCQEFEFSEGFPAPRTRGFRPARWGVWQREVHWRAEFLTWLQTRAGEGIAMVGNGAQPRGAEFEREVAGQGTVLRFNRFSRAGESAPPFSARLDAWVRAPDYRGPAPAVEWMILTGPASQFTLWEWGPLLRQLERGTKLVCVPLDVWRALVRRLEAPPSSGALVAFWLSQLPGVAPHLRLFGFGYRPGQSERYHEHLPQHRPSGRHNWEGERALLEELTGGGPK